MDAKMHFCDTCGEVLHEVSLYEVPSWAVNFLLEFLQGKGLGVDLTSGWVHCKNCGGYFNMPAVEALSQKYFT